MRTLWAWAGTLMGPMGLGQDPYGPYRPGPGPLWALMGPGQDPYGPYGPGPGPLWALRARARTLMGPLGPIWGPMGPGQDLYGPLWAWARTLVGPMGPGQDPYRLQQKSPPRAKLFGAGVILPWAFLFRRISCSDQRIRIFSSAMVV